MRTVSLGVMAHREAAHSARVAILARNGPLLLLAVTQEARCQALRLLVATVDTLLAVDNYDIFYPGPPCVFTFAILIVQVLVVCPHQV